MRETPSSGRPGERPGEFELIARLKKVLQGPGGTGQAATRRGGVLIGIGDDAAAVELESGVYVFTTDTMVDGVHFRRGQAQWRDVGWKSAVSNLSDIAAMGAKPLHALATIGVPKDIAADDIEELYRGMGAAFAEFGGEVVGGDVVSSPVFFVTVALTGAAATGEDGTARLLRRDAARPGDLIGVTGTLGGSAGGLRAVDEGRSSASAEVLKRTHFAPRPRITEGAKLTAAGVTCAMDVSDGLLGDLAKICEASDVGAVIEVASVPMPRELRTEFGDDALEMALTGGEDYELVFTASFDVMDRLMARNRKTFTHIGRIVEAPDDDGPRVQARGADGRPAQVRRAGWDHLRDE